LFKDLISVLLAKKIELNIKNRKNITQSSLKTHGCANSVGSWITAKNVHKWKLLFARTAKSYARRQRKKFLLHSTNSIKIKNVKNAKEKSSLKLTRKLVTNAKKCLMEKCCLMQIKKLMKNRSFYCPKIFAAFALFN
jgi:hypothetical protein